MSQADARVAMFKFGNFDKETGQTGPLRIYLFETLKRYLDGR